MASPILDQTLPNGLQVILREDHDAPLASFWTWYRVGSRNEFPGVTGISHWVEHMQFKGTESLAKGEIFREVSKQGGTLNAMTSQDWTAYFETLPADRLDLSLRIEPDRMANSLFDRAEVDSERTVILAERQMSENRPTWRLSEELIASAFHLHPYRHMVIGYATDLRQITRDQLYAHYRQYYKPNNAFVVAVGDFDAEILFARVAEAFGQIAPEPPAPPMNVVEPPQHGERRVTLRRPAPTAYLRMAFHAPDARDPDTMPLVAADAILSGGKGMGFGGGGGMGRSSRLYRALVASGLARAAGSDFDLYLNPYVFTFGVTALPGIAPERIEETLERELARLREETVPDDELARAIKQVKAQYVYGLEGVTNQAFWLGQMEIVDSYTRVERFIPELEAVTPADVQRVAQTYFVPDQRTIGWLLPSDGGDGGEAERRQGGEDDMAVGPSRVRFWTGWQTPPSASAVGRRAPFERVELPNGIVILGQARPDDPAVVVRLRLHAGAVCDPLDQPGLASFTARMLPRGTDRFSFAELNELTDNLGAAISADASRQFAEVGVRCLREDLEQVLDLAATLLRQPAFPEDELEKVRQEVLTGIREQDNDTGAMAELTLRRLIYPAEHPLAHRVLGTPESVAAFTRDDLVRFHAEHYGPNVLTVAIVGGIRDIGEARDVIGHRLGDWTVRAIPPAPLPPVAPPTETERAETTIPGKSQSDLAIGYPTISRENPGYYALETANLILGRLGLYGRLGADVRDRQGLAYYVYSAIDPGRDQSLWVSRAGVAPENVARTTESIIAELRRLRDEPVSAEELADAKSALTGSLPLALETSEGVAAILLNIEYFHLGLDYVERFPSIIDALTREDLQRAAIADLNPDRLAIGVAGPA